MVVAQYEALRGAALGDALPPEARTGLLLFLRGGMWGWARAVATNVRTAAAKWLSTIKRDDTGRVPSRGSYPCRHGHQC
jgi:hypothetical protein